MKNTLRAISVVLTLSVLGIAVTIEFLNFRAGGILPRHEYRNGDPSEGLAKWRYNFVESEKMWLRVFGPRTPDGTPVTRPLTYAERLQMEQDVKKARSSNDLRGAVLTVGLWQYVLVPASFMIALARRRAERVEWTCAQLIASICAAFLMFYPGYFSSLGW